MQSGCLALALGIGVGTLGALGSAWWNGCGDGLPVSAMASTGGALGLGVGALTFSVALAYRMLADLLWPVSSRRVPQEASEPQRKVLPERPILVTRYGRPPDANPQQAALIARKEALTEFVRQCAAGNTTTAYWDSHGVERADYAAWRDLLIRAGYAAWNNPKAISEARYRLAGWSVTADAQDILDHLDIE